ncbi:MAG: hypothetical protein KAY21_07400 [Limnohabitans sp.]|jgi:hypothetical protein|nr:hypothetical protein [Limnohabitans sp.]
MTSPFENLVGPGKALRAEPPDAKEFAGLQRMGLVRLHDAQKAGLGPEVWRVLSKCHDARNLGEYEGMLEVDSRLVAGLIAACRQVAVKLDALAPIKPP